VAFANAVELEAIRHHLSGAGLPPRTFCRILDAILWTASPGAELFGSLTGWEQVLRPRASHQIP
jgi:hypothetical protein